MIIIIFYSLLFFIEIWVNEFVVYLPKLPFWCHCYGVLFTTYWWEYDYICWLFCFHLSFIFLDLGHICRLLIFYLIWVRNNLLQFWYSRSDSAFVLRPGVGFLIVLTVWVRIFFFVFICNFYSWRWIVGLYQYVGKADNCMH